MPQATAPAATVAYTHCEACGRRVAPPGLGWLSQWYDALTAPYAGWQEAWGKLAEPWWPPAAMAPWTKPVPPVHSDCPPCPSDDCTCQCCVSDADLVVHTRLGEQRVVPIVIGNDSRRDRDVELELGRFRGGSEATSKLAEAVVLPRRFRLGPCQDRTAMLLVQVKAPDDEQLGDKLRAELTRSEEAATAGEGRADVADVDRCEVLYADLRVIGCDTRPVRIALAVLPRECAAHRVECHRACC